jgi:hypothetical protein
MGELAGLQRVSWDLSTVFPRGELPFKLSDVGFFLLLLGRRLGWGGVR